MSSNLSTAVFEITFRISMLDFRLLLDTTEQIMLHNLTSELFIKSNLKGWTIEWFGKYLLPFCMAYDERGENWKHVYRTDASPSDLPLNHSWWKCQCATKTITLWKHIIEDKRGCELFYSRQVGFFLHSKKYLLIQSALSKSRHVFLSS